MDDLYRDEILEHYRRPHNFGTLEHPDVSYEDNNPLCGDRMTLMLDLADRSDRFDVVHNNSLHHLPIAMAPILQRSVPGARNLEHPAVLGARHFLQEDAGQRLGELVATFVRHSGP